MTDLDLAAGQVILHCPSCGAREATDPAVLAGSPRIVCRNCGETWPAPASRAERPAIARLEAAAPPRRFAPQSAPRLIAAPAGEGGSAWAAKIEADTVPQPRRARAPIAAAALGAMLFAAAFLGGREVAVAALPDLAGLYAAVGLPVNLVGLAIEDVAAERSDGPAGEQLTIRGTIRNVSGGVRDVPPLMAEAADPDSGAAQFSGFEPPVATLAAGGAAPFVLRLEQPPPKAAAVAVRFRRPAEAWAAANEGVRSP